MRIRPVYTINAALLAVLGALFMFPLILTFTNSFMTEAEIALHYNTQLSLFDIMKGLAQRFVDMQLAPDQVSISPYQEILFFQPSFLALLANSLKLTLPVVLGNGLVSLLSAFGFTLWRQRYKEILFMVYVIVMLMPLQAVIVSNYIIADRLQIKDSYLAIILPGIFAPFGTFLLRQSMKAMPPEYFEAAAVDGAGLWAIFIRIVAPQMKAGLAALCMLVFIEYWNLVEQPIIFIKDYYREPLSVYLSRLADGKVALVFAASCIYMLLPLWLLAVGQKPLEQGIELSGIKS